MLLGYSLLVVICIVQADLVDIACERNPELPYCKSRDVRRKQPDTPEDPFEKKFRPQDRNEEEDDISLELEETTTPRPHRPTTPVPLPRQNMLFTVFPTLQTEKDWRKYCPLNQYTFQVTCLPGKKLRYDLQVFCQEFSEKCGVPNINLYPSRFADHSDDGRPKGYGQKQKNGQLGLGRSFGFGLGAIPGLEVVSSQGADIGNGNLPFLNQIGGIMLNYGTEMGALGQRIGKGPARSMNALTHGYPSFGLGGQPNNGDKKLSQEVLKSFGVPNLPGLNKIFNKLGGNRPNKRVRGYEPGYGAVNPNAPLAIGKVDRDAINLPGGFGDVEVEKGGGFGIGK
ncbi:hypothetical protein ANCDUO_07681 [Ancylostoma duodenale]|uniref:Uncharacterized protein n=1 Tax=Ancylostoma duodenale TaxID=51022 RepID=A0A0C2GY05_9BILA|nr:hypothetical protein ANCDUO_07681 [Ancylostoma duodenale]